MALEEGLKVFNDALKTVNQLSMKEVDEVNDQVNQRGCEVEEINNVMKDLIGKFSGMEERMHVLEEEGLVRKEMIAAL